MTSLAFNRDCMEAMREFPDKFFDLAVVDPPYGDGCSQSVNVERERERERESCTAEPQTLNSANADASAGGLTSTISATRTGGGWFARKYSPERTGRPVSSIGMSRRRRNTSTSLPA